MKTEHVMTVAGLAALVVLVLFSFVPNRGAEWKQLAAALQNVRHDRLEAAVQAFTRDHKAAGGTIPATVALRELVAHGYIGTNDIRGLEGKDASVSVTVDETTPQTVLIRVHERDGYDTALMADGSVVGLPRGPHPQGGANGSQPIRSETNTTSPAAGSRRSP